MQRDQAEAQAIAQSVLDATGVALLSGSFDAIERAFAIPTVFDTFEGQVSINSVAALADRFTAVRSHYANLGVTDQVRHILAVDWFDVHTIHTSHQSRLLRGTELVQAPYTAFSILKRIDGDWKVTFSQYAIPDSDDHNSALLGADPIQGETND